MWWSHPVCWVQTLQPSSSDINCNKPVSSVARTVLPWSCGDPSQHSSVHGQPEPVGVQTHSSSSHLAAWCVSSGSPAGIGNITILSHAAAPCSYGRSFNSSQDGGSKFLWNLSTFQNNTEFQFKWLAPHVIKLFRLTCAYPPWAALKYLTTEIHILLRNVCQCPIWRAFFSKLLKLNPIEICGLVLQITNIFIHS
jgi:hypothetical protein